MGDAVDRFLELLDLERRGDDTFRAATPSDGPNRLFGGQVASQTLRAATLTVEPERRPNSLHASFIRPGTPGVPLDLEVERTRDGRSLSIRRVVAAQQGEPIFVATASFHVDEQGDEWQLPAPAGVPDPEESRGESFLTRFATMGPFDIRPAHDATSFALHPFWARVREPLPDDLALHACVIAFISDMGVVGSARAPGATTIPFAGASLDHALWLHRPARADRWLLFSVEPFVNAGARGLARGAMHTEDGLHVASIAQEALLRPTRTVPIP